MNNDEKSILITIIFLFIVGILLFLYIKNKDFIDTKFNFKQRTYKTIELNKEQTYRLKRILIKKEYYNKNIDILWLLDNTTDSLF
jgi:hypothetical protein